MPRLYGMGLLSGVKHHSGVKQHSNVKIHRDASSAAPADGHRNYIGSGGALLVFDGQCKFCKKCVNLLAALDTRKVITAMPSNRPGLRTVLNLTDAEAVHSVWLYAKDSNGRLYRCAGAAAVLSAVDLACGFGALQFVYHLPGVAKVTERAYRFVADHRGSACGTGDGSTCSLGH